jgi:general stress protein 26
VKIEPRTRRLIDESMIVRLATVSASGQPRVTPLWFIFEGGHFYMNTREASPAVRDILANREVVLLLERDKRRRSKDVLRVRGQATFHREASVNRQMYVRSALKYHFSVGGLRNLLATVRSIPIRARYYRERAGEAGTIEVIPESAEMLPKP